MTSLIARIDAAITGIGNKLCNALDASLYHDWDLEDTPNDGADPLAEREAEEDVAGTHPRPTPANQRQLTGRRHDHHEHHQQCVLQLGSTDERETGVGPNRCWRARL